MRVRDQGCPKRALPIATVRVTVLNRRAVAAPTAARERRRRPQQPPGWWLARKFGGVQQRLQLEISRSIPEDSRMPKQVAAADRAAQLDSRERHAGLSRGTALPAARLLAEPTTDCMRRAGLRLTEMPGGPRLLANRPGSRPGLRLAGQAAGPACMRVWPRPLPLVEAGPRLLSKPARLLPKPARLAARLLVSPGRLLVSTGPVRVKPARLPARPGTSPGRLPPQDGPVEMEV